MVGKLRNQLFPARSSLRSGCGRYGSGTHVELKIRDMQRRMRYFLALALLVGVVLSVAYRTLGRLPVPSTISHACNEMDKPPFTNEEWSVFTSALHTYKEFHNAGVKQLRATPATQVRTLTWSCKEPGILCAGIGDQLRRIAVTFLLSVVSQ